MKVLRTYPILEKHLGLVSTLVIIDKDVFEQMSHLEKIMDEEGVADLVKLTKKLLVFADKTTESPWYMMNGLKISIEHIETIKKFNLI